MSVESQIEESQHKIRYMQKKYNGDKQVIVQRSLSPNQKTTAQSSHKRIKSAKIKLKINSHNFLQKPRELLGGGFYKRSEIYNSVPIFKQTRQYNQSDDEPPLFPQIENQQYSLNNMKVNSALTNLAQIQEENELNVNTRHSHHKDQKKITELQRENSELQQKMYEYKQKEESLLQEIYDLQTKSMAEQVQYYLQGSHHCHFEEQTFELLNRLRLSDEILARVRAELEKVIGLVKNYNTEGLLYRILELEQLIKDLDVQRDSMIVEIEMLGLQRDDWHEKHSTVQNKLINLSGTDQKLLESQKKVKMQGDTLEKLNRRLKERQIEIQDWQRKCVTGELEKNKKILELENYQRSLQSQLNVDQNDLQQAQSQLNFLLLDSDAKKELLDDEKRKTKQLHSEILDLRVNRITGLQDEIAKQKKIIQQRVEEIEELEVKVKQLNRKIDLQDTQIKNFEEVAEQKLQVREQEWIKKFKDLEKQIIQLKQQNNLQGIQIEEKDIFIQLKTQECEDAHKRIHELLMDIDQHKLIQLKLLNQITQHELTIAEKVQIILLLEEDIKNWVINNEEQLMKIKEFEIKTLENETIMHQQSTQIEGYKSHVDSLNRQVDQLKQQIEALNQQINKDKLKFQEEVLKVQIEREKNQILREDLQERDKIIQDQKNTISSLEEQLKEKLLQIKQLERKIVDMQAMDEFLSAKLKKQLEQLEVQLKDEKAQCLLLQTQVESAQQEILKMKQIIEENVQKISNLQAETFQSINQIQALTKKEKELTEQNTKLLDSNRVLSTAEEDLKLFKVQASDFEKIMKDYESIKDELQKNKTEKETLSIQLKLSQQNLLSEQQARSQYSDSQKATTENMAKQLLVTRKQLKISETELVESQHKLELLMDAMEGMNNDEGRQKVKSNSNNPPKKEPIGQTMEKVKQVFVDDKIGGEQVSVKFEDLQFDTKGGAHLTIAFWVRIGHTNLKDSITLIRIQCSQSKQNLLELGVKLDSGAVFATYYPKANKVKEQEQAPEDKSQKYNHRPSTSPSRVNDNVLTVTSQLSIRLDRYAHIALTLNEYGTSMDMGLILNGVRDDQVSVSRSVLLPDAVLIFGSHPESSKEEIPQSIFKQTSFPQLQAKKLPKFIIKDALVMTKTIQSINIFKHINDYFTNVYNFVPESSIKRKQLDSITTKQIPQYYSSGDLVYNLLQQDLVAKPHQKQQKRMNSPPNIKILPPSQIPYQVNNPVNFKGRMVPSNLVDTCDLLREQSDQHKREEQLKHQSEVKLSTEPLLAEEDKIWSRRKAIQNLKQAIEQDYSIRGLLRPLVQHYQYVCQTLQLMSPPHQDGSPFNPFQGYLHDIVPLVKLQGQTMYLISLNSFMFLLDYCGLQKITKHQMLEICQNAELVISKNDQHYFHYDHLMIILREVVMNKAEATIMKYQEKETIKLRSQSQTDDLNSIQSQQQKNLQSLGVISAEIDKDLLLKQGDQEQAQFLDFIEEDLETLEMLPLTENWNQGKFTVVLNRCKGCEKHAHTTRHQESDFIEKSILLQNSLREQFPNIDILENVDKTTKLESFELYIKGVGNKAQMDKDGRLFLFIKNESVTKFQQTFESRLPRIYEKLTLIMSIYETSLMMGLEQTKFLEKKGSPSP